MRNSKQWLAFAVLVALAAFLPGLFGYYGVFLASMILVYVMAAQGLNLLLGWTGQISIGHAGFCAIGAYTTLLCHGAGWPFALSLLVGILVTGLIGFLLGIICIPMSGPYLALATIGFGIIVEIVATNWVSLTGGADGLTPPVFPEIGPFRFASAESFYYLVLALYVVLHLLLRNLMHSRVGRAMMAVREDPIAAAGAGINVKNYRLLAFTASGCLAALGGAFYAYLVKGAFPDFFTLNLSSLFIMILVVGGMGTLAGPIIGSAIVVTGFEVLRGFREYQMIAYSLLAVLMIMYMPRGLVSLFTRLPLLGGSNGNGNGAPGDEAKGGGA